MEAASFMTGDGGHHIAHPWVVWHPDYFAWAFVRNPYTRFVSAYVRCLNTFRLGCGPWAGDTLAECLHMLEHGGLPTPYFYPQTTFICDHNGELLVDFVGRFEQLYEDWEHVCTEIGVPYEPLAHKERWPYPAGLYTDEVRECVNRVYADDFRQFGYRMVTDEAALTRQC